jgi:acetyltransferase-like isoleucine patch superfamily enzyme
MYRLIMRFWPLPEGDIAEGSREELLYHLHIGFYLMLFYPILYSRLLPIPLVRLFYLALGADLGRNVFPPSGTLEDPSFLTIGANTVIGYQSVLCPHLITGKQLSYARIQIGNDVTIGIRATVYGGVVIGDGALIGAGAVIGPHAIVGENAIVKPCSFVKAHMHVPHGETWSGVPATVESFKTPLESRT